MENGVSTPYLYPLVSEVQLLTVFPSSGIRMKMPRFEMSLPVSG